MEKTLNPKYLKLLFIVPTFFGSNGEVINERELAKALSKKVKRMYVISFLNPTKYLAGLKEVKNLENQLNCKLIVLPNLSAPLVNSLFAIINVLFMYINSLALMLMSVSLKKLGLVDAIYLRDPRIAIAFFSPRKIDVIACIKFPGFYTQEIAKTMHFVMSNFVLGLLERVNYIVVNKADLLVVQSGLYKTVLQELYDLPRGKKILIIPAGINLEELSKRHNCLEKRKSDKYRIGYIGSLAWWNGLDILVNSMHIVQKTFPNAVLYINAGGSEFKAMNSLKERIKKLGVRTIFLGPMSHAKALELMSTLDMLVVPRRRTLSTELTIPIKVIEAFALGVPVIITRHRIFKENYRDYKDILLVEPEPKDIAQKIIMLLSDSSLASELSKQELLNSREFDYNDIASRLVLVLSQLR